MYRIGRKPAVEHQPETPATVQLRQARTMLVDAVLCIDDLLTVQSHRDPDKRRNACDVLLDVRLVLCPPPREVAVIPGGDRG